MYCSRCGAQLVPDAAFCAKCGAAVVQPVVPPPSPVPPSAPPPSPAPVPPRMFTASESSATPLVIKRPGIVTFLAVLQLVGAAFWLLGGLGTMMGSFAANQPNAGLTSFIGLVFVAVGAAQLLCGIGLLKLKPYGRTLQLAFAWLGLIALPIGTIVSVLILIYLFKPGIKLIFAGRPGDDFTEREIADIKNDTASSGTMVVIVIVVSVILGIAVIGMIAAIAIPGLMRARTAGNEASAIASLRAIQSAEVTYASTCAQGGYAVSLDDLVKPPRTGGSSFITPDLGQNGVEKAGYIFSVTRDRSPIAGDVGAAASTCNGSVDQPSSSYFAVAEPSRPGVSGTRYFAVDARGTIFESSHAISNPIMDSTGVTPIR